MITQVRIKSFKRFSEEQFDLSHHILLAGPNNSGKTTLLLYVEGESDLNLLREWARVLKHKAYQFLSNPFWHSNEGRHPREARGHFFALNGVKTGVRGILILDGDNRSLADNEITTEGLTILRWNRYEAENYLLHPEALARFVKGSTPDLFSLSAAQTGLDFLKKHLPPAVFDAPLDDHEYLTVTPASKSILPGFFEHAGASLTKSEYYQVASQMLPHEIPDEVHEMLDRISQVFRLKG